MILSAKQKDSSLGNRRSSHEARIQKGFIRAEVDTGRCGCGCSQRASADLNVPLCVCTRIAPP